MVGGFVTDTPNEQPSTTEPTTGDQVQPSERRLPCPPPATRAALVAWPWPARRRVRRRQERWRMRGGDSHAAGRAEAPTELERARSQPRRRSARPVTVRGVNCDGPRSGIWSPPSPLNRQFREAEQIDGRRELMPCCTPLAVLTAAEPLSRCTSGRDDRARWTRAAASAPCGSAAPAFRSPYCGGTSCPKRLPALFVHVPRWLGKTSSYASPTGEEVSNIVRVSGTLVHSCRVAGDRSCINRHGAAPPRGDAAFPREPRSRNGTNLAHHRLMWYQTA